MQTTIEWKKGVPPKGYGWYLVTYLSKDVEPVSRVTLLWYNKDSTHKWWLPGEDSVGFTCQVTHYAELPQPAIQD